MDPQDWSSWGAQEPPRDFAEKVVDEAMREKRASSKGRGARIGAGLLLVASMAAAVAMTVHLKDAHARGDVKATAREEVRVGGRAIAVLEPGAHVSWNDDAIAQSEGDVFWRVEPGARFVVHTPAADVTVKGTCFRVQLDGDEGAMNGRDVRSGAIGAVLAATAFVGVYEGKVAVSHAGQSVDITAGQQAKAGPDGVSRVGGGGGEGEAAAAAAGTASEGEQALTAANANLASDVQRYRRKLEALEDEKKKLEKELDTAQAKLGDAGPQKSEYDLGPEDWKELAKEGELRTRVPCNGPQGDFSYSPKTLDKLGLAAQDGPVLQQALQASNARTWGVIQPLCSQALGGIDVTKIGQTPCLNIIMDMASAKSHQAYDADMRQVTEIMAGMRPPPAPGAQVDPLVAAELAMASESQNLVNDLAKSLGPEEAKHVVFADQGCWHNSGHGFSPPGDN
jgi:ferric-dicitrate binding protein FerR (iron transport regulator)